MLLHLLLDQCIKLFLVMIVLLFLLGDILEEGLKTVLYVAVFSRVGACVAFKQLAEDAWFLIAPMTNLASFPLLLFSFFLSGSLPDLVVSDFLILRLEIWSKISHFSSCVCHSSKVCSAG